MTTNDWSWSGSRWWKIDFHAHTPASDDYGHGEDHAALQKTTPRKWLLGYMRAGIDCVVVTDHNSGAWVDPLKEELSRLEEERPDGYRRLTVFPGVEISVHGGAHVLAILDRTKTTADVNTLLTEAGFEGEKGRCNGVTRKAFSEVVAAVRKVEGLAIPAHADAQGGIFDVMSGETLRQAILCEGIIAVEIRSAQFSLPGMFLEEKKCWTRVLGSDSHHPDSDGLNNEPKYPGSHFTWVKMGQPSLEGLRLALLDGELSVLPAGPEDPPADPNEHAPMLLESMEVDSARFMGRSAPFSVSLNPWLNTIIGGRGSGKSTLVEFLRIVMRREKEIPQELAEDLAKYLRVSGSPDMEGLQTPDTALTAIYRKDGARFRIQWSQGGDREPIQRQGSDGSWVATEGEVSQRFPIRLYSQKQIFQLARSPRALLEVVDQAPEVDLTSWRGQWREEESRFLSLRARAREIESGGSEAGRLRGELEDILGKLKVFETSGHSEVLTRYQRRRRQTRAVELWEESWAGLGDRLREVAESCLPEPLEEAGFDVASEADQDIIDRASTARDQIESVQTSMSELANRLDVIATQWRATREASAWKQKVTRATEQYERLKEKLSEEGAGDPSAYGELVQRRQAVERRLRDLEDRQAQATSVKTQATESLHRLLRLRRELTSRREAFIDEVLEGNPYVRISVRTYADKDGCEAELRELIQREGSLAEKDIGSPNGNGLLGTIYGDGSTAGEVEANLEQVKSRIKNIASGDEQAHGVHQKFADHLRSLQPEALDRLDAWFPEDSLTVEYSQSGDGQRFVSIAHGSPGQKTAALLAFLLAYGNEPLIVDQPEDDLDNRLIYDLIVAQLREVKRARQVIVVTHNANIVVNGDSELVIGLRVAHGQTHQQSGCLQEHEVRQQICEVMEGGREAFEQRYRRIALEAQHV